MTNKLEVLTFDRAINGQTYVIGVYLHVEPAPKLNYSYQMVEISIGDASAVVQLEDLIRVAKAARALWSDQNSDA